LTTATIEQTRTKRKLDRRRAVRIAKDVLEWLGEGLLHVGCGSYIREVGSTHLPSAFRYCHRKMEVQDRLELLRTECTVCALGACFLAYVDRYDSCTFGNIGIHQPLWPLSVSRSLVTRVMLDTFTSLDMELIEAAFECRIVRDVWCTAANNHLYSSALGFGRRYVNQRERLKAIMRNIIKHKGQFVPSKWRAPREVTNASVTSA
jgi:hypothetical protein